MSKNNIGSTIAIILSVLLFASGLPSSAAGGTTGDGVVGGPMMLLGALAYRSAKKTYLSVAPSSLARTGFEFGCIVLMTYLWLARNDLKLSVARGDLSATIVPIWALIAFAIMKALGIAVDGHPRTVDSGQAAPPDLATAAPPDPANAAPPDLATRLRSLKNAHEQGLISLEEYEAKRKEILAEC